MKTADYEEKSEEYLYVFEVSEQFVTITSTTAQTRADDEHDCRILHSAAVEILQDGKYPIRNRI
jgi:hypothetical protein